MNKFCGTRLYQVWADMKKRCYYTKSKNYHNYGGRGITVCDEWHESIPFCEWALANGYSDDLYIDRINVNGDYCPDNCRFVTWEVQCGNKQDTVYYTAFGETKSRTQWLADARCVVGRHTLKRRVWRGWDVEKALVTPELTNSDKRVINTPNAGQFKKGHKTTANKSRLLSAFGDTKYLCDWASDPRCTVSYHTLHQRLLAGWTPEEAVSKPKRGG